MSFLLFHQSSQPASQSVRTQREREEALQISSASLASKRAVFCSPAFLFLFFVGGGGGLVPAPTLSIYTHTHTILISQKCSFLRTGSYKVVAVAVSCDRRNLRKYFGVLWLLCA